MKQTSWILRTFVQRISACQCPSEYRSKVKMSLHTQPCLPQRQTSALTLDPEAPEGGKGHSTAQGLSSVTKRSFHKGEKGPKLHHGGIVFLTAHYQFITSHLSTELRPQRNMQTSLRYMGEAKAHRTQLPDYIVIIILMRIPSLKQSALVFGFYLFQKTLTSVLSFSKLWSLHGRWKTEYNEAQQKKEKAILYECMYTAHVDMYCNHMWEVGNHFVT